MGVGSDLPADYVWIQGEHLGFQVLDRVTWRIVEMVVVDGSHQQDGGVVAGCSGHSRFDLREAREESERQDPA